MTDATARFVVDRREGQTLVIEDATGAMIDVPANELPSNCRAEGAVLEVPMTHGAPNWGDAKRNRAEERRILKDLGARLDRLRRKDPGGDVEL